MPVLRENGSGNTGWEGGCEEGLIKAEGIN
jgi:hypothetical protein